MPRHQHPLPLLALLACHAARLFYANATTPATAERCLYPRPPTELLPSLIFFPAMFSPSLSTPHTQEPKPELAQCPGTASSSAMAAAAAP